MGRLTLEERNAFVQAASALISKTEKIELMAEQVKESLGNNPGRVPLPQSQADDVLAPGYQLTGVLAQIKKTHPNLPAIRFRGKLFIPSESQSRDGVSVIDEAEIESIEE